MASETVQLNREHQRAAAAPRLHSIPRRSSSARGDKGRSAGPRRRRRVTRQKLTVKVHRARRVVAPVQHDHAGRHGLGAPSTSPAVTCVVRAAAAAQLSASLNSPAAI